MLCVSYVVYGDTYRDNQSIAHNLDKLLVQKAHITCSKEANISRAVLLDGNKLLRTHSSAVGQATNPKRLLDRTSEARG